MLLLHFVEITDGILGSYLRYFDCILMINLMIVYFFLITFGVIIEQWQFGSRRFRESNNSILEGIYSRVGTY